MHTHALFHVMPDSTTAHSLLYYACLQAAHYYRQQQKVFVFTQSQQQAHDIDELLWQFEPESFVPHNLAGEGPKQGAPVEISWQPPKGRRPVLINLAKVLPNFSNQFSQIIDFVPNDEADKQLARERFRACRQMGFSVNTQNIANANNAS